MKLFEISLCSKNENALIVPANQQEMFFAIRAPREWIIHKVAIACETQNMSATATCRLYNTDIPTDTEGMPEQQQLAYRTIHAITPAFTVTASSPAFQADVNYSATSDKGIYWLQISLSQAQQANTSWAVSLAGRVSGGTGL